MTRNPTAVPGLRTLYQRLDQAAEGTVARAKAKGSTIYCKEGCSACCYGPVLASFYEALGIVDWFRRSEEGRAKLSSLTEKGALLAAFDAVEGDIKHLPCVLLEDGKCSAYPMRPGECRMKFSTTPPKTCEMKTAKLLPILDQWRPQVAPTLDRAAPEMEGVPNFYGPLQVMLPLAFIFRKSGFTQFFFMMKKIDLVNPVDFARCFQKWHKADIRGLAQDALDACHKFMKHVPLAQPKAEIVISPDSPIGKKLQCEGASGAIVSAGVKGGIVLLGKKPRVLR